MKGLRRRLGSRVSDGAAEIRPSEVPAAPGLPDAEGWPVRPAGLLLDLAWVALYLLFAGISTMLNPDGSNHAPLWLPTGLGLGLALARGWRPLPSIALGAALFHGADELDAAGWVPSLNVFLDITAHVVGELVVTGGAALWLRRHTGTMPFGRIRHLLQFVAAAGVLFPALAATLVYLGDAVGDGFSGALPIATVHGYVAARAASALLAGPAVAAYLQGRKPAWTRRSALQVATVFLYAVIASAAAWGPLEIPAVAIGLLIALAPPVVWLSMVLGRRVSQGALLVAASIAILGAHAGWGPLPEHLDAQSRLLAVQFLHVSIAYGSFYLAIANRHREERLRQAEQENARLALLYRTDALTGLWNRHHVHAHLQREHARLARGGPGHVVLMLDVDHFKRVNDRHGHGAGDAVLLGIAEALQAGVRDTDIVGRWGGEEFLVVLDACDTDEATAVAEALRRRVCALQHDDIGPVSVSIGVAEARADEPQDDLIARADAALYVAKRSGRDRVVVAG